MALDYFAIVSGGVFPTPTPTGAERMAFIVTRGLLGTLPVVSGWLHTINTVASAAIASVNTVLRANISTINTT